MDIIALYAEKYGGVPRDEQTWHEVLALVNRIPGFEARARLNLIDAQRLASPMGGSSTLQEMQVARYERLAEFKRR